MILVSGMNRAKDIKFDAVLLQPPPTAHHLGKTARAPFVNAIRIMQFLRPVKADADEEIMLFEEVAPGVIEQRAIGLQRVVDFHAGSGMFLLQLHRPPEKIQPHESRFAALPGKGDFRHLLGGDVLARECFQYGVGHAELAVGIHHFFGEEVTIFTVQIANGPARFGHEVKGGDGWAVWHHVS